MPKNMMKLKCSLTFSLSLVFLTVSLNAQKRTFENQYLKIDLETGWTAKAVSSSLSAINITKDKYVLYIATQTAQASGVEGGRFSEISMGAKSADAVLIAPPTPPCGDGEETKINRKILRNDLFVSSKEKQEYCRTPTNGKNVWYFSYIYNSTTGGYFNYYRIQKNTSLLLTELKEIKSEDFGSTDEETGWVITMAYNSKDINSFPQKGSPALNSALDQMVSMVKSLKIKH